jgi:hypothetical protein
VAWIFVCYECCVLSGKGLCNGLITHPEESYRLWCVECDLETSKNEEAKALYRAVKIQPQWVVTPGKQQQQTNNCMASNRSIIVVMPFKHKKCEVFFMKIWYMNL